MAYPLTCEKCGYKFEVIRLNKDEFKRVVQLPEMQKVCLSIKGARDPVAAANSCKYLLEAVDTAHKKGVI
jgi:hypothetical protein